VPTPLGGTINITTPNTILSQKGGLIVGTGGGSVAQLTPDVDGTTLVANSASATGVAWTAYGSPNFVINGGFDIWQRGTAVASIGSNNNIHYLADRWCSNGYQDTRMQRIALGYQNANLNSQYAMRNSSSTTAQISFGTRIRSSQKIESVNSYLLAGKTVTVSYWVKFSAATISSSTATPYNNWGSTLDYYTTTTDANHDTVLPDSQSVFTLTNGTFPTTWTKVSYTATIPTGVNNVGISFGFDGLGSTASADTAYYDLAQVQLEIGSVATPFRRTGGTLQGELAACQRYYWSLSGNIQQSASVSGNSVATNFAFPVQMRAIPTVITNMTGSNYFTTASPWLWVQLGVAPCSLSTGTVTVSTQATNQQVVLFTNTGTFNPTPNGFQINGVSFYLNASAEL
jgi:hypothetical protein